MTPETKPDGGGVKFDAGKAPMWLLPGGALIWIARVLGYGGLKYFWHNWRRGMDWSRPLGAIDRHVAAVRDGEWLDKETGLPHLACAGCEILFLLQYWVTKTGRNDLFQGETFETPDEALKLAAEALAKLPKKAA